MGSWTVGAGSVDLIGGYWEAPFPGQQSVDMAGFYQNGTIKQDISGLTVGQTYALTFYLAGNPDGLPADKTLDVSFGGAGKSYTFVTTPTTTHSNMGWELETEDFVANSTSEWLVFADASATLPDGSPTAFGAVIGDVSLTAVPEPSTVFAGVLLLLPLGVSAIRVLRRDRTV
jgi:choice-of-anchor C domain-containing protein